MIPGGARLEDPGKNLGRNCDFITGKAGDASQGEGEKLESWRVGKEKPFHNFSIQNSIPCSPWFPMHCFCFDHLDLDHLNLFRIWDFVLRI